MQDTPEPANHRFLRRLVTTLTAVMILGLVVLIALFVMRFSGSPQITFPDAIDLPNGVVAVGYTQTERWVAIMTEDNRVLVYDRATLTLAQEILLE
jgi:hypothetical protein